MMAVIRDQQGQRGDQASRVVDNRLGVDGHAHPDHHAAVMAAPSDHHLRPEAEPRRCATGRISHGSAGLSSPPLNATPTASTRKDHEQALKRDPARGGPPARGGVSTVPITRLRPKTE